jgi:uncharacterized protein (TIGR01777 family)
MLGTALHQALATRQMSVLQLVRRAPAAPNQLQWNPAHDVPFAQTEILEGLSAAVHLSGASVTGHRWTAAYKREMTASRVDSTRALATTLARLRQPPGAFLVASAIGIYGSRADEILDESSAPGSGFLADLCQQWESAARPAVEAGIRVVHLRFGVVLGPGPGALASMVPLFRLGLGGRLGSGRQWMSWISLADAISAIVFALCTSSLAGPVNLTAPQPVTNGEFARSLGRILHRPAILPVPAFALRLAVGPMADEALLASSRVLPAKLLGAGFQFMHPTVDKALSAALVQTA